VTALRREHNLFIRGNDIRKSALKKVSLSDAVGLLSAISSDATQVKVSQTWGSQPLRLAMTAQPNLAAGILVWSECRHDKTFSCSEITVLLHRSEAHRSSAEPPSAQRVHGTSLSAAQIWGSEAYFAESLGLAGSVSSTLCWTVAEATAYEMQSSGN
jgi:hypothetical protein